MGIKVTLYKPVEQQDSQQVKVQNVKPEHDSTQVSNPSETRIKEPIFMKAGDVSTVDESGATRIHQFLNSKDAQKARRTELTSYLLQQTNEDGQRMYTYDQAKKLAKAQVKNEKDQAKSKVTIPFIDKEAYEKFKDQLKAEGKEDLYTPKLIKNKKVLAMINDPKNAKTYFMTDEKGELIKGANGQYIFDPEKYKAEMVKDTSGYRLTLTGRAEHAEKRGLSKNAEKDAVKAAGLGYRKDRTWLYRSLLIGAGVSSFVFGGAVSTAIAGAASSAGAAAGSASAGADAGAYAKATATNRVGQIIGGVAPILAAAFVSDKDGKNVRGQAQEVFENRPQPEAPKVEVKEEPKPEPKKEEPVVKPEEECPEPPCMRPEELPAQTAKISTIVGGGPYHYAQLYVDENGKPFIINSKTFKELQKKLSSGKYAIQTVDRRHRELLTEIPLENGVAKLADDADAKAKRGFRDAVVVRGSGDRKYAKVQRNGKWIIVFCEDGKQVPGTGQYNTREKAQSTIDLITTPAK